MVTSTVTTSVRDTMTSRQRLSDSSKMERMSCGALLSTSFLAACAASSFSNSSSGGGGGSKRSVRPKVRAPTLSSFSVRRMGGYSTVTSSDTSPDRRRAQRSGFPLARPRMVTSMRLASTPTKRAPAHTVATGTQAASP